MQSRDKIIAFHCGSTVLQSRAPSRLASKSLVLYSGLGKNQLCPTHFLVTSTIKWLKPVLVGLPPAQSERTGQLRLRTTQYRSTKRYGRKPPIPHLTAELWPDGMLEARSHQPRPRRPAPHRVNLLTPTPTEQRRISVNVNRRHWLLEEKNYQQALD